MTEEEMKENIRNELKKIVSEELKNMKLHDFDSPHNLLVTVHRVQNGWNYIYQDGDGITAVFVPEVTITQEHIEPRK